MDGVLDFLSREAGQRRRRDLEDAITYYVPPELRGLLGLAAEANPVVSMERAGQDAQEVFAPDLALMDRLAAGGRMASNMAAVAAPAMVAGRAAMPAAQAVEEALLGFSATPAGVGVMDFAADESGALRAFHGSPHDFDRFSLDKIGTGEGAQAYGRGLYFAEAEDVAKGYRDTLANGWRLEVRDPLREAGITGRELDSASQMLSTSYSGKAAADDWENWTGKTLTPEQRSAFEAAFARKGGRMYEVEINANPEDFIDYDAPLSAQSPTVQRQFGYVPRPTPQEEVAAYELAKRESPNDIGNHPAVQDIYRREAGANAAERNFQRQITGGGVDEAARITLSEAGIPGIRYLDAGSRGAGDGSRNYVVFDDSLIEILRKYGVAGLLAAGGGAAAMQPSQAQAAPAGLLNFGGGR